MKTSSLSKLGPISVALLMSVSTLLTATPVSQASAKKKTCPRYEVPEWAGDAETTLVTPRATERNPLVLELTTGPGVGLTNVSAPRDETGYVTHVFHNIVVDSSGPSAELFVRLEFIAAFDYDLFLRDPTGPPLAYEADFNQLTAGGPSGLGQTSKGHAEPGISYIDGPVISDCAGNTLDIASSSTPGGPVTLTIWQGK